MSTVLMTILLLYILANISLMIYLMGKSNTIDKTWEMSEFKRKLPKHRDLLKFIGALFYFIPMYLTIEAFLYFRQRRNKKSLD